MKRVERYLRKFKKKDLTRKTLYENACMKYYFSQGWSELEVSEIMGLSLTRVKAGYKLYLVFWDEYKGGNK